MSPKTKKSTISSTTVAVSLSQQPLTKDQPTHGLADSDSAPGPTCGLAGPAPTHVLADSDSAPGPTCGLAGPAPTHVLADSDSAPGPTCGLAGPAPTRGLADSDSAPGPTCGLAGPAPTRGLADSDSAPGPTCGLAGPAPTRGLADSDQPQPEAPPADLLGQPPPTAADAERNRVENTEQNRVNSPPEPQEPQAPPSTFICVLMRLAGTSHDAFFAGIKNSNPTDYTERVLSKPQKNARNTSLGLLIVCGIPGRDPLAPVAYIILSNCQMLAALGVLTSWVNLAQLCNLKETEIK
ncbi:hypothetical protein C8R48DRAFT_831728, partial [Suillus tomentosus]